MTRNDVKKTQLIWPGKTDEDRKQKEIERIELPFQIVETINESRATRDARKRGKQHTLYDMWFKKEGDTFKEGWKNKLIWGENKLVISSLIKDFAGKIDLIYIDPPFATGADFSFTNQIGENGLEVFKEQSIIEEKVYRDTWGQDLASYLQMMYDRLVLMRELLSKNGSIYVHLDWHVVHYVKIIMDEIFGEENLVNEIIWQRKRSQAWETNRFGITNDTILLYKKTQNVIFNPTYSKEDEHTQKYIRERFKYDDGDGRKYMKSPLVNPLYRPNLRYVFHGVKPPPAGWLYSKKRMEEMYQNNELVMPEDTSSRIYRKIYLDEYKGQLIQNIWIDIPIINPMAKERLNFDTQKPEALLERIIETSSDENSLVADFFCGSGTTLAVAEKLKRRWIGCDLSRWAIHITRKRLLGIQDCKPFELLNLGKYERKYWQTITFGKTKKHDEQLTIFEYLQFMLKLYGAEPLSGMEHLHGRKGGAVIHIGSVDAPVTIDEINACLDECDAVNQKQLHILGWEWEMGLYDLITEAAKGRGIKLILVTIPREVMEKRAVESGDIQFYELAYLEADIIQKKNRKVVAEITDFVIPNYDLLSEEIRESVKKWSDYIDYWAVDWDFQNDTFMNGWVTYRTRKDRKLFLKSDPHKYDKPGKYTIMVKVVDVFGNDTSQASKVEVK